MNTTRLKFTAVKFAATLLVIPTLWVANVRADDDIEAKYAQHCVLCHGQGLLGAPKAGDKVAWAPRVAQGNAVLLDHAKNGYKQMPAKGTCATCSDEDLVKLIAKLTQ